MQPACESAIYELMYGVLGYLRNPLWSVLNSRLQPGRLFLLNNVRLDIVVM